MNDRETGEVRRSLNEENSAIVRVSGAYVNATGAIIAVFDRETGKMEEEEEEKYRRIFKKVVSGTQNRNLLPIEFSASQVGSGEEHALLSALRKSDLTDEEAKKTFFEKMAGAIRSEDNYVILLTENHYDVPFRAKDGSKPEDAGEVFSYLLCAVCPVKPTKAALTYDADGKTFRNDPGSNAIGQPEVGFLFPSFEGRRTNLYGAQLYSRTDDDTHDALTKAIFGFTVPMAAKEQTDTFHSLLAESLGEDCSFELAKNVRERICDRIEEHKQSKDPEPLVVTSGDLKTVLEEVGVEEEKLEKFEKNCREAFGDAAELPPKNLVSPKRFEVRTPDVKISVSPDRTDLVETRTIGGVKYILIRAEEGVELNGLSVSVPEE